MRWEFEVLELISKRPKDIGTKCSWDIWLLGQNVFGTFGFWDKSLYFRIFLGHMALGQNVIGKIYLWAERFWDNSPRMMWSLGQKTEWTYLWVIRIAVAGLVKM